MSLDQNTLNYLNDLDNSTLANDISKLYTNLGEDATDLTAPHVQELTDATDGVKTAISALKKVYGAYKEAQDKLKQSKETNVQLMYQLSQQGLTEPKTDEEKQEAEDEKLDREIDNALDNVNLGDD